MSSEEDDYVSAFQLIYSLFVLPTITEFKMCIVNIELMTSISISDDNKRTQFLLKFSHYYKYYNIKREENTVLSGDTGIQWELGLW